MSELELKFQVPQGGAATLLKAVGTRDLLRTQLSARYFDTTDHLLGRHGMALRLRNEDGIWVQTLKATAAHALERLEENVDLGRAEDAATLQPDPQRHAGTEAGDRLARLLKAHDHPPLVELYRTEVARCRRLLRTHGAEVEWALDEGSIAAGERMRPLLELELEHKGGEVSGLFAAAHDWQARHGLWIDPVPKAQRGALLVEGRRFVAPVKAEPPCLARSMDGDRMLRAMVAASLSQILPNAAEVAAGSDDPEHVHQLRVGMRRLRTAVRELERFASALDPEWKGPVDAVFDAAGEARDRHVLHSELAPELVSAGAPLADPLDGAGDAAAAQTLLQTVRGAPFQGALLQLLAFAHGRANEMPGAQEGPGDGDAVPADAQADTGGTTDAPAAPAAQPGDAATAAAMAAPKGGVDDPLACLQDRLAHLHRQVTRDADRFDELPIEKQHRLRRRLKRLRYLAQFAAPLYKPRRVEVWLNSLEPAQDALGRHIDRAVAARRFEEAAAEDPRAWFAAGWLRGQLADSAHDGRKSLERFARAAVFW
jgi:inorganic triphosphatase YgiF